MEYRLAEKDIKAIERVLQSGNRVEIIPVKDGIRINIVRRESVKAPQK